MTKKIAVLAGDGIGPEIMAQALKVLVAMKLPLEFEESLVGGVAYAAYGHPLPESCIKLAKESDAVVLIDADLQNTIRSHVIYVPNRQFWD